MIVQVKIRVSLISYKTVQQPVNCNSPKKISPFRNLLERGLSPKMLCLTPTKNLNNKVNFEYLEQTTYRAPQMTVIEKS